MPKINLLILNEFIKYRTAERHVDDDI